MRILIFGLTISSSWGNGHATLWRGLTRALAQRGHLVTFFERDVPYYASHRDLHECPGGELVLFTEWSDVVDRAHTAMRAADAVLVTSYCPDARAVAALMLREAEGVRCFYDMDTPVTLSRLDRGEPVEYLPDEGLGAFDLVLSYTGGAALDALRDRLGARRVAPFYGAIDPETYQRGEWRPEYGASLSHLGTYAADRRVALDALFLAPATRRPDLRFLVAGSMYPADFGWQPNVFYIPHVWPGDHADFYSSSDFTLNITRGAMARMGYCPQGRLFEAAACETVLLTDTWSGLDTFFAPGEELVVVENADEVVAALEMPASRRRAIGTAARARVLRQHTSAHRATELEHLLTGAACPVPAPA